MKKLNFDFDHNSSILNFKLSIDPNLSGNTIQYKHFFLVYWGIRNMVIQMAFGICILYFIRDCYYSCSNCSNDLETGCISCGLNSKRKLMQNKCICEERFFDNNQPDCE